MTGPDGTFGVSTHRGIELALNEINARGGIHGKKLRLISVDDQGKAGEASLAVTQLISRNHVRAVLGEVASSRSLAMAPVAQSQGVPMISPSSIHSKLTQMGDYIFRVCFVDQFQSKVMAQFAAQKVKAKKVALLTDSSSDYSVDSAKLFTEHFKKLGGEVIAQQSYSNGDIDFKSQLTSLKGKNPDLILVPGYYTDVALIARQAKELGMKMPLLGGDGWDSPKLKEIGGQALDGSYFVSHFAAHDSAPHIQSFVKAYRAIAGSDPDGLSALGYDSARVLAQALEKETAAADGRLSGATLRDAIARIKDFPGVTGKISIGPDRNAVKSAIVFQLKNGGNPEVVGQIAP
jgi:branched-chain amino acid transport system substrate-binding protein